MTAMKWHRSTTQPSLLVSGRYHVRRGGGGWLAFNNAQELAGGYVHPTMKAAKATCESHADQASW